MSTDQSTIDELLTIAGHDNIRARKMFGESGLYCNDKVVGFVCDDQLFLKITDAGLELVDQPQFAPAYPGSKDYLLIDRDRWYEEEYLLKLISATASALPHAKPKKPEKKKEEK
jgi:DNA transformation protein